MAEAAVGTSQARRRVAWRCAVLGVRSIVGNGVGLVLVNFIY